MNAVVEKLPADAFLSSFVIMASSRYSCGSTAASASSMRSRSGYRFFLLSALFLAALSPTFCGVRQRLFHPKVSQGTRASVERGLHSDLSRRAAADSKGFSSGTSGMRSETKEKEDLKNQLRIQPVGTGRGSFILEMGGVKILVNPKLQGSNVDPARVHEEFDYVFLTSEEPEFFDRETVSKMKLTKARFIAAAKAGEETSPGLAMGHKLNLLEQQFCGSSFHVFPTANQLFVDFLRYVYIITFFCPWPSFSKTFLHDDLIVWFSMCCIFLPFAMCNL